MTLDWIFDPVPASGARQGGLAQAQVLNRDIDTFVREVLQNARDQRQAADRAVEVRFTLEDLTEPDLSDFLSGIAWGALLPHLEAIASAGYVTISPKIRASLADLATEGRLRLLRVDDHWTRGLTGGEDDTESNFNALCRHTLITSGGRRDSGGSFGLGKSVLWAFSGLSTVLFSSTLSEAGNRKRFFGRTLLAWHDTDDDEWEGSGWLGAPEERGQGVRAISVWDENAAQAADGARIGRTSDAPGTSILVIAFDDPSKEEEDDLSSVCTDIANSAARWFWPAILRGDMSVSVVGIANGEEVFHREAGITPEVSPFVSAQTAPSGLPGRVAEPRDVAEREIELRIPAQRPEQFASPLPRFDARALLRLRLAETGEDALQNTVALQRGTGMVVQYLVPARRSLIDAPFHATLIVGTGHGTTEADHAAEEFLRAAEPVAHSQWTSTTERIHAEYLPGAQASLRQFHERIAAEIGDMLSEPSAQSTQGPDELRRLFPIPGAGGGSVQRDPYRLSGVSGRLIGDRWDFAATFTRATPSIEPWKFSVAVDLEQEGGIPGERLRIDSLRASAGQWAQSLEDGSWTVTAPPDANRVYVTGQAAPAVHLPSGGMTRTRVRIDVRPLEDGVNE